LCQAAPADIVPPVNICVFASSSDAVAPEFLREAADLGSLIGRGGHSLVFGGGMRGMMGALARAAKECGARVTGVIPSFFNREGVVFPDADSMEVTATMRERKARMEELADAFIALPGGFGTMEELAEVISLCQLGLLSRPIALINTFGFYDLLAQFFDMLYRERFSKPEFKRLMVFAPASAEAISSVEAWKHVPLPDKFFHA
jgi:uncharacterized protein (TIGR00730 family)